MAAAESWTVQQGDRVVDLNDIRDEYHDLERRVALAARYIGLLETLLPPTWWRRPG